MAFKIKIYQDDQQIAKAKGKRLEDFDNLIEGLKEKMNGSKKPRY
jgi:hypothetical protein